MLKDHEVSNISSSPVYILVLVTILIILSSFFGLSIYFQSTIATSRDRAEAADVPGNLALQRQYEASELNSLEWISRPNGVVKLPIEYAKKAVIRDYRTR